MIELALGVVMCVAMGRIASADDQSGIIWGFLAGAILFGCFAIPLPYLRVLIAGGLTFVALIAWKTITDR